MNRTRAKKYAQRIIAELLTSQIECGAVDNEIESRFPNKAEQDAVYDQFMILLDDLTDKADGP